MVTQTVPDIRTKSPGKTTSTRCVHHWLVRPPQGENSWGECRKCGRRKRFSNRFDGRDRANNSDIFAGGTTSWKPDRRASYHDPAAAGAGSAGG